MDSIIGLVLFIGIWVFLYGKYILHYQNTTKVRLCTFNESYKEEINTKIDLTKVYEIRRENVNNNMIKQFEIFVDGKYIFVNSNYIALKM